MEQNLSVEEIIGLGEKVTKWEIVDCDKNLPGVIYCGKIEDFQITVSGSGFHSGVQHYNVTCENISISPPIVLGKYFSSLTEVSLLIRDLEPYEGEKGIFELCAIAQSSAQGKLSELETRLALKLTRQKIRETSLSRAREIIE